RLGADRAHILDGFLVTDIVRPLDGVVHVPAPIVVGIRTGDSTGDTALGGYSMGTRRKHLGNDRGLESRLGHLQGGTHAGATAAHDYAIKRHCSYVCHYSSPPEDFYAPKQI